MPTPPFRSVQIFRLMFLLMFLHALAVGCAGKPTGTPILVDPTTTQRDVGGSDDILEVCQAMVTSMRRNPEVESKPVPRLVLLEAQEVYVDPLLQGYNARMLYNQFTAILNRVAGAEFKFIDRKTVSLERERQLSGAVKTSGVDAAPAGADMVLKIELIALLGRDTNTVQYNFKLTDLNGIDLWTDNKIIVKRS